MLSCRDLRVRYHGASHEALRGVSLGVEPGRIMGIAGRSGSGKSTLLRCLAGQLAPSGGELEADGCAFAGAGEPSRAYRLQVGLAAQLPERQLFAPTVWEDVAFGPRNLGLAGDELEGRVAWALGAVGIDRERFAQRNPFTLSGGEARRVAIAGVLALRPRYLLLDEPTAGLDPRQGRRLLALLPTLAQGGMGIVVVSHDVDALAHVCSDAVLMDDGAVSFAGGVRDVLGDTEKVRACGLIPSAEVELAERLRERGVAIPAGVLTAGEIARTLGVEP